MNFINGIMLWIVNRSNNPDMINELNKQMFSRLVGFNNVCPTPVNTTYI